MVAACTIHQYIQDMHEIRFTNSVYDGINAIAIQALNMSRVMHEHCKMTRKTVKRFSSEIINSTDIGGFDVPK